MIIHIHIIKGLKPFIDGFQSVGPLVPRLVRPSVCEHESKSGIVAKASDGQRYPLPPYESVCECEVVRGAAALKEPMTYA